MVTHGKYDPSWVFTYEGMCPASIWLVLTRQMNSKTSSNTIAGSHGMRFLEG